MSKQDYPTQPPSEQQPYPPGQPVYVQAQPVIINSIPVWGTTPQQCICPSCKGSIVSRVSYETGTGTWLIAGGICLVGLWCGCQFIPFCVDGAKDAHHHCPNCNQFLGSRALVR